MSGPPLRTRVARAVGRRAGLTLVLVLLTAAVLLVPASRLRVVADLSSLLPPDGPASADYRRFLERFGGFEKVFVLVEAGSGPAGGAGPAAVAEALAGDLQESPEVARARAGLSDEDEAFFLEQVAPRAPLLVAPEEVAARLRPQAVREQVALWRERLAGPGGAALAPWMIADPLGLAGPLAARRAGGIGFRPDPGSGAFLSPDGRAALVIVTPARHEIDPAGGRALQAALESAYARARGVAPGEWTFLAVGGPLYAAHDEAALRVDLRRTASASLLVVTAILLLAFRGPAVPAATLVSLAVGLAWTGGWLGGAYGRVTAVGVGFTSILVGLGVDYGIHAGARFREARLEGRGRTDALEAAFRDTGPGIVASALTTAAGFGCLSLAALTPLREMGRVVAVGILAILTASATGGAAFLVLASRSRAPAAGRLWAWMGRAASLLTRAASVSRPAVLAAAALLTGASLWAAAGLRLDADPRRLRPDEHPLQEAERRLAAAFSVNADTATVIVEAEDLPAALDAAAAAAAELRGALPEEAELVAPSDWIVAGERLRSRGAELARLPLEAAADALQAALDARGFRLEPFRPALDRLRALADGRPPGPPPPGEWPDWLRELVRPGPGGTAVAIPLRLPAGSWPDGPPPALVAALDRAAPGAALASVPRVGAELRRLALADLRRLGWIAGVATLAVIGLSFRGRAGDALRAATPAALGCAWTFGLWGALGRPLDLFCLAAMPVMVGIGVDDGLHAVHRAARRPADGLGTAVERTGRAMILTTMTTAGGFASLALSRLPALRNGGLLIATGILACLLATLVVLPALPRGRR